MSGKEEIDEKIIKSKDPKENDKSTLEIGEIEQDQKRFFGRIKRKYRLMLIFLVCLSLILLFMVFPVVIVVFIQNS